MTDNITEIKPRKVGRPLGRAHDKKTRERIQTSLLVKRLQDNAMGTLDKPMTPTQVNSAIALINRTLPVLAASSVSIDDNRADDLDRMSDSELQAIASGDAS